VPIGITNGWAGGLAEHRGGTMLPEILRVGANASICPPIRMSQRGPVSTSRPRRVARWTSFLPRCTWYLRRRTARYQILLDLAGHPFDLVGRAWLCGWNGPVYARSAGFPAGELPVGDFRAIPSRLIGKYRRQSSSSAIRKKISISTLLAPLPPFSSPFNRQARDRWAGRRMTKAHDAKELAASMDPRRGRIRIKNSG